MIGHKLLGVIRNIKETQKKMNENGLDLHVADNWIDDLTDTILDYYGVVDAVQRDKGLELITEYALEKINEQEVLQEVLNLFFEIKAQGCIDDLKENKSN